MSLRTLASLALLLASTALAAIDGLPAPAADNAGKPLAHLTLGQPAPEITATTPDGKPTALLDLRAASTPARPIVLQFASLTDPIFRMHAPSVERLAQRYTDKVTFVVLYEREAHAANSPEALIINTDQGFNIAQPLVIEDRWKLAREAVDRLNLKHQTVLVDALNDTSALRYGSYPNMTFIIDDKGLLKAAYPWMDPPRMQGALDALLAGRPIPQEFQGSVKLSAPAPLDFTGAALDMTGGRNAAALIATTLDKLSLSDQQKMALYPALAEYLASLQEFRATAAAVQGRATRAGQPPSTTSPAKTPQDVQSANSFLHAAADHLKIVIKQDLGGKDAGPLFEALEQGQAQHLFINP